MPLHSSDSHSTHPKVVKAPSTTWDCRMWFSSAGVQPLPGSALWSALSGNPSSSCKFSPIHSANLVGSQRRTGFAVRYTYSNHFGEEWCPSGRHKDGAGFSANSIRLGLRRLMSRRTQPVEFFELACKALHVIWIYLYIHVFDWYVHTCTWM